MNAYVPSERLRVLVDAFCTDAINRAELRELDALLRGDPEARKFHAAYCRMHAELMFTLCAEQAVRSVQNAEPPVSAPTPVLQVLDAPSQGLFSGFSDSWPLAYLLGAVIFVTGLWVGSLFTVEHYTQMAHGPAQKTQLQPSVAKPAETPAETVTAPTVGRITDMADCRGEARGLGAHGWKLETAVNSKSEVIDGKSAVTLGDKFVLTSGLLEITYASGAKVILQGPTTYTVDSTDGGYLSVGKLTAKLEKKLSAISGQRSEKVASGQQLVASGQWSVASEEGSGFRGQDSEVANHKSEIINHKSPAPRPQSPAPVFAVRTPTATVTDLGTEFGVEVDKEGYTSSHVFRGSVQVRINGQPETTARVLHENETVRVEKNRNEQAGTLVLVTTSTKKASDFVRRMPKQVTRYLDLVDVVAGGNGFMGRRNGAIDPTNGGTSTKPPENLGFTSDGQYHRVPSLPMIDGVFIPQGKQTAVQIDSAGHKFDDFGNSSDATSDYVWAIGVLPSTPEFVPLRRVPYKVGDVNYGSEGHGALFLHANKGITFDLDAVRHAHPRAKLRKFVANVGSTFAEGDGNGMPGDIRVFVDGKVQFQRRDINVTSGDLAITVPLRDDNRFLTLTATEGGRGIGAVWIVFGDPRIEMSCVENPAPSPSSNQKGGDGKQ